MKNGAWPGKKDRVTIHQNVQIRIQGQAVLLCRRTGRKKKPSLGWGRFVVGENTEAAVSLLNVGNAPVRLWHTTAPKARD